MPTMKIGEKVTVTPEFKALADKANEERKDAATAFREAARWMSDTDEKFWKMLREAHPELKDFDLIYRADGTIIISGRRAFPEDE